MTRPAPRAKNHPISQREAVLLCKQVLELAIAGTPVKDGPELLKILAQMNAIAPETAKAGGQRNDAEPKPEKQIVVYSAEPLTEEQWIEKYNLASS